MSIPTLKTTRNVIDFPAPAAKPTPAAQPAAKPLSEDARRLIAITETLERSLAVLRQLRDQARRRRALNALLDLTLMALRQNRFTEARRLLDDACGLLAGDTAD